MQFIYSLGLHKSSDSGATAARSLELIVVVRLTVFVPIGGVLAELAVHHTPSSQCRALPSAACLHQPVEYRGTKLRVVIILIRHDGNGRIAWINFQVRCEIHDQTEVRDRVINVAGGLLVFEVTFTVLFKP